MDNKIMQKMYFCDLCNFESKNKSNYLIHLDTKKHIFAKKAMDNKKCKKSQHALWLCSCGKAYKFQSGLCKHKLKCGVVDFSKNITIANECINVDNIVKQIVNENQEFKKLLIEQQEQLKKQPQQQLINNETEEFKKLVIEQQEQLKCQQEQIKIQSQQLSELIPKIGNNTVNQKFNINIFLNETCKNAINMSDFINSIKISVKELDMINTNGLAKGLSNAIINNMQHLKVEERPIHCTDIKRETLYIKDDNVWACDASKCAIKQAIKLLSGKPFHALQQWKQENPDFMNNEHQQQYFAKALQVLGENNVKVDEKVIRAICNHTHLKR